MTAFRTTAGRPHSARALIAAIGAALLLGFVIGAFPATVLAETPTPGVASSPAPSPSPSPGASSAPCPNPTPSATPTPSPGHSPAPTPAHNLCPAEPHGADPFSLLAWAFTPIFQVLFLGLVTAYKLLGDIGLGIVVLTLAIRLLLVPVFRAQIVSQRRMQLLQPELKAIQQKYRGDRTKISEEQLRLYRERGVNPAAGCLPTLLTMLLLIPMYSVFSQGLSAPDISSMLQVFGTKIIDVPCQFPGNPLQPCINPTVHWLFGMNASKPEILFTTGLSVLGFPLGLSLIAVVSALLQLVQTRMMMPSTNDPQAQAQQRVFLILPLISLLYGTILPAGLFIYWIVTTIFSIVQQYLIAGWGSLFPLFGWTPGFARDHKPRFPVPPPTLPKKKDNDGNGEPQTSRRTPAERAAGTVRPARSKGRTSRRGRRR
jgi:YidC/Oxa1 family membrane protein insertase